MFVLSVCRQTAFSARSNALDCTMTHDCFMSHDVMARFNAAALDGGKCLQPKVTQEKVGEKVSGV